MNTKTKGDIGQAVILADLLRRGCKVAIPFNESWDCDLIIERNNKLERVQTKYTTSDGDILKVRCSCTGRLGDGTVRHHRYTADSIDWIAVYDATTTQCFYIPSSELGAEGRREMWLRLSPPKQMQKGVRMAHEFLNLDTCESG